MKLGESGEAFFVEEIEEDDDVEIPEHLATSPIPVSEFENLFKAQVSKLLNKFKSNPEMHNMELTLSLLTIVKAAVTLFQRFLI